MEGLEPIGSLRRQAHKIRRTYCSSVGKLHFMGRENLLVMKQAAQQLLLKLLSSI